jgi:glycosyltransferase involved in cell wall biosynthesis
MRVLFMSWRDLAHPQAGGCEYVNDRLAIGLTARGHEVALLCGDPVAEHPYRVHGLGGTYAQYARAPFAYHRRFRRWDVLVDVENGIPFFSPVWRRGPVVCLVHHVHVDQWSMYFRAPAARLGRALETAAMPRIYRDRLFVAVSRSTADSLVDLGVDPSRIRVVEMGVEPVDALYRASPTPLFLALGRLVPHKRVELLLELWERVRPVTGGTLVIAGEGPEHERLRDLAGDGVELRGAVTEAEKRHLLGAAWILVHAAHHEGWGTVIMEAAAAGTPTVAFDVPGVRDSVVDGETGILADGDDAFVRAWSRLATDATARAAMSERARARAATFTWDRAVERFERVLVEAVGRAPAA